MKKIDRMNNLISKRESVLLKKWEDQITINEKQSKLLQAENERRKSVQYAHLHGQDDRIRRGFENYLIQKQQVEELQKQKKKWRENLSRSKER